MTLQSGGKEGVHFRQSLMLAPAYCGQLPDIDQPVQDGML